MNGKKVRWHRSKPKHGYASEKLAWFDAVWWVNQPDTDDAFPYCICRGKEDRLYYVDYSYTTVHDNRFRQLPQQKLKDAKALVLLLNAMDPLGEIIQKFGKDERK